MNAPSYGEPMGINCTVVELKLIRNRVIGRFVLRINCTVVELKRIIAVTDHFVLNGINCTVVELKLRWLRSLIHV